MAIVQQWTSSIVRVSVPLILMHGTLCSTFRVAQVFFGWICALLTGGGEMAAARSDDVFLILIARRWAARVLGRRNKQFAHGGYGQAALIISNVLIISIIVSSQLWCLILVESLVTLIVLSS